MQNRDMQADLAKLEGLVGELDRLRNDVTDILAAGDGRAEVLLSQLGTVGKTAREYLPYVRDLAAGSAERQQAVSNYIRTQYQGPPKRGAA